jgi:4-amino-4-deoxychorismate lyase
MCQLVESLKLKDGVLENLAYHQARLDRSMAELYPDAKKIVLSKAIQIPAEFRQGLYKVRVVYRATVEKIEMEPYHFRNVQSLKVVRHESIDYHLKYTDRQILQQLFAQRGDCDDIIIVKSGLVTDALSANLLFFDGQKWVTPDSPLLKGTQRQFLLDRGIITEQQISEKDISKFQKIGLINAMVSFEEMPVVGIENVVF